jgi:hypothetical protein
LKAKWLHLRESEPWHDRPADLFTVLPHTCLCHAGRSSRHQYADLGFNPLSSTMEVMLWDNPEHKIMKQRVKEWCVPVIV